MKTTTSPRPPLPATPEESLAVATVRSELEQNAVGEVVVTSLTIAQGAGVEHRAVLQLIDKHQAKLERFGTNAFEMRSQDRGGHPVRIALLNEQQSTLLMTFMRNTEKVIDFKVALVDAFFAMAKQLGQAFDPAKLTKKQALQMALESEERAELAEAKIKADAPKVDYVDRYVAGSDQLSFKTVASTCRINESKLRELLIACEWIFCEEAERWSESKQEKETVRRYSEYSHKKPYFIQRHEHKAPRFRGEVMHYLKITPAGSEAIARLIKKAIDKHGDLDTAIQVAETRRQERITARKRKAAELDDGLF